MENKEHEPSEIFIFCAIIYSERRRRNVFEKVPTVEGSAADTHVKSIFISH